MRIERILLPTDFSHPADVARPHAIELARRFGAKLVSLHVRTIHADDPERILRELDEAAEDDALIERMASILGEPGSRIHVESRVIRDVSAAAGILDFLKDEKVDLIVMGTHGRTGLAHFLLGSVAERVVRHAACPVLTVGHSRKNYSPHYEKILVAFDFSEHSKLALRNAAALARKFEAELGVIYVLEQEVSPAYFEIWKESITEALPEIEADAQRAVTEVLKAEGVEASQTEVVLTQGKAHKEIVKFADSHNFDLIAMGTHGLSGIEHVLLGSTTERVVRTATCPVITFKHMEQE